MTAFHPASAYLLTTLPCKYLVLHAAHQINNLNQRPPVTFNRTRVGFQVFSLARKQTRIRRSSHNHGSSAHRSGPTCAASHDSASLGEPHQDVLKFSEVCSIARSRGMHLKLKTLGPLYTIECKDGDATGQLLATTNGFVVPALKLMHCDTMRIFTTRLAEADRVRIRGGSFFGLSLLIAAAVMSHGHECRCRKAEILAINDDDHQHRRLVKYYTRLGFHSTLEVGNNGLSDLPHLLVWGGAGTRMNCIPEQFLQQWSPTLRRHPANPEQFIGGLDAQYLVPQKGSSQPLQQQANPANES